jgi:hypothetical protein
MMTMRRMRTSVAVLVMLGAGAATAAAQDRRAVAVEGTAGWAGFVDDGMINHTLVGGAVRVPLGEGRLSLGPEIFYTRGPGSDRDVFVLGSLWIDLVPDTPRATVVPYCVAGLGYTRHSERFGPVTFASSEGSYSVGGGARVRVTDRVYAGGDVRLGWELHLRATAHVGVRLPAR